MKKRFWLLLVMFLLGGCSVEFSMEDEHLAYLSHKVGNDHEKMFEEMNMGILLNYDLKLTKADKTWVTVWVEGYRDGEPMTPSRLTELSYGFSQEEEQEGSVGFGIIQPESGEELVSLYAPGATTGPEAIPNNPINTDKPHGYGYTLEEEITLDSGDTKVIGAYYESEQDNMIRSVDMQTEEGIEEMIHDEHVVLLLKIKVEERAGEN